jgi:cell division protein ZapA
LSKVSIRVNDRAFSIGCEPGQEAHVQKLGEAFDNQVSALAKQVGQIGDLRLFLMAALVISDELEACRSEEAPIRSDPADQKTIQQLEARLKQVEQRCAEAIADAAQQVERITEQLSS